MCHERWALHVVIKRKFFFTFITVALPVIWVVLRRQVVAQSRCTVVRPMQKSIRKWKIRPLQNCNPWKYHHETLHTWLRRRDYRHANFGFNRYSGGFFPNMRNITTVWHFSLSCSVLSLPFFLDPKLYMCHERWALHVVIKRNVLLHLY